MIALALYTTILSNVFQQKLLTKLGDLKPVTSAPANGKFEPISQLSIGGIVVSDGLCYAPMRELPPPESPKGMLVYAVPPGSTSFTAKFGIPDGSPVDWSDAKLNIYIDGDSISQFSCSKDAKPTDVVILLKAAKSIKFVFEGYSVLTDGAFSAASSKPSEPVPKTPSESNSSTVLGRVNLTAPENGSELRDKASFQWDSVDGAIAYGVEIVLVTNATKVTPTRFIRAFTAKGNTFDWAFSDDVVSGEYQVSVIAFGKKGVLTRFSNSRRFIVKRRAIAKPLVAPPTVNRPG